MSVDRSVALFGTKELPAERERYTAGRLSYSFEGGAIRHVHFDGVEVIRGIGYLLRDENWATPTIELGKVTVERTHDAVTLSFPGRVRSGPVTFDIAAEIEASAVGELEFRVIGTAGGDFAANRIGFTVLHPTPECEDIPLRVEHLNDEPETTRFPLEISPSQPVLDIKALTYSPGDGVEVRCEMHSMLPNGRQGPFEMEDQRNWSDASFKTYVGSLLEPWPYDVLRGDRFEQRITLRCSSAKPSQATTPTGGGTALLLELGPETGETGASIGLAVSEDNTAEALRQTALLARAGVHHLTAYVRAGGDRLSESLADIQHLAAELSFDVTLEVEMPCEAAPAAELDRVADACKAAALRPASVLACPADYLRSYQPTERWPDLPPLAEIYAAARGAFPESMIGGGMLSYFTELNRKWPPAEAIDYVSHTVAPIVHAADDATLMENLATIPAMGATVRTRLGGIEHRLGPSAISMRHNPYGSTTIPNMQAQRIAMGDADPRERGLLGAAWTLGLAVAAQAAGIRHLTLFAAGGTRSVLYTPGAHRQPWFDDVENAKVRPLFHVVRGLAALSTSKVVEAQLIGENARRVAAFAATDGTEIEVWFANLTDAPVEIQLPAQTQVCTLDVATFEAACHDPDWLSSAVRRSQTTLTLDSYAVARCHLQA